MHQEKNNVTETIGDQEASLLVPLIMEKKNLLPNSLSVNVKSETGSTYVRTCRPIRIVGATHPRSAHGSAARPPGFSHVLFRKRMIVGLRFYFVTICPCQTLYYIFHYSAVAL